MGQFINDTKQANALFKNHNIIDNQPSDNTIRWHDGTWRTIAYANANFSEFQNNLSVNPAFINPNNADFRLQPSSPMIDAGAFLTNTTSLGNGTTLQAQDADYFMDSWGIIEGDLIQLEGQTQTARIINVNYNTNTITKDTPLTWSNNQGVSLAYSGSTLDMGAYEYTGTPQPQTCTSFTYSDWSPAVCPQSEIQSRTVISSSPSGCTGGYPTLTQSCAYIPPTTPSSIAINAGGLSYTASDGISYSADTYLTGGTTSSVTSPISNTTDNSLYQTRRIGNPSFSYAIQIENGNYSLTLQFSEHYHTISGGRIFNVTAEGQPFLSQFDIATNVGGSITAYNITKPVNVADNTVNSLDLSLMNAKWNTSDPLADINGDGVVHTLDWSIMNGNWTG